MLHVGILFHGFAVLQVFRRGRQQELMRFGANVADDEADLLAAFDLDGRRRGKLSFS
jgi:hypothetical protein